MERANVRAMYDFERGRSIHLGSIIYKVDSVGASLKYILDLDV